MLLMRLLSYLIMRLLKSLALSAHRFIQQVNQAVVTIQRWYRRHMRRRQSSAVALRRLLISKKKVRCRGSHLAALSL